MDQPRASRYALAFIFITMFVDTMGLGITIPVAPKIIAELTGPYASNAAAMSASAWYGGLLQTSFAAMLFLFSPLIGNLSDRFGRRPVLIVSLLALGIDYTITGLAPTIGWLFIGRILSGIAGAAYTTANAYIADVSPPEKRAANFGLVGAAFGIGFVVGPALGGLIGQYGARLPFFVAAALAVANALFGWFVLKESLPPGKRRKFEFWRANPVGSLIALRRYPAVLGFVAVLVLMRLAHDANPVIWSYYVYLKFHWTTEQLGLALAFRLYRIALRRDRLCGLCLRDAGLDDVSVDAGVVADGAGHALDQRHHFKTRAQQRARRVAGRAVERRRRHLHRGAVPVDQCVRVFHRHAVYDPARPHRARQGFVRAGLFRGCGIPRGRTPARARGTATGARGAQSAGGGRMRPRQSEEKEISGRCFATVRVRL
jgi:multidrug resistance protein